MGDSTDEQQQARSVAQLLASLPTRAGVLDDWRQRGGLRGCFDGRQRLASAFWLVGVGANLLLALGLNLAVGLVPAEYGRGLGIASATATTGLRLCSWYCILRCRHNTERRALTALALITTLLDIALCVLRSADVLNALFETGAEQEPVAAEGT